MCAGGSGKLACQLTPHHINRVMTVSKAAKSSVTRTRTVTYFQTLAYEIVARYRCRTLSGTEMRAPVCTRPRRRLETCVACDTISTSASINSPNIQWHRTSGLNLSTWSSTFRRHVGWSMEISTPSRGRRDEHLAIVTQHMTPATNCHIVSYWRQPDCDTIKSYLIFWQFEQEAPNQPAMCCWEAQVSLQILSAHITTLNNHAKLL